MTIYEYFLKTYIKYDTIGFRYFWPLGKILTYTLKQIKVLLTKKD